MSMFRRSATHYGRLPQPVTPYQKAAQVWDERIGSARVQARNWRAMAFASLLLAGGFAAALVWQSARGTVVPWVVEVDQLGKAQLVAPANADYRPTDPQIAWHLARFITEVRSIPADPIVVRQNWLRAYDWTTTRGAAALNDYARANDPFAKVGREQVTVEVSSVIRASPDSFRVAWSEQHYQNGQHILTERWSAILTIQLQTPRDPECLRANPLGIYIDAISWSLHIFILHRPDQMRAMRKPWNFHYISLTLGSVPFSREAAALGRYPSLSIGQGRPCDLSWCN